MALPKVLFLLPFFVSVMSEVTEKDLQEKLGIDVKGLSGTRKVVALRFLSLLKLFYRCNLERVGK